MSGPGDLHRMVSVGEGRGNRDACAPPMVRANRIAGIGCRSLGSEARSHGQADEGFVSWA